MSNHDTGAVHKNGGFGTSLGFVLACVGSAVGMGNIWLFPYRLGQYGGAAFLIPYFIFVVLFGLVGLSAEFAIGRRAQTGTLGSYEYCWASRGKGKLGYGLGWIPLFGSLGIAIGYGLYYVALMGGVLVLIVLMSMQKIVHVNTAKKVEIKFVHRVETIDYINAYFDRHFIQTLDLDFTVEVHEDRNIYTNLYTLHLPSTVKFTDMVNDLSEHPNVMSIRTAHA